MQKTLTETKNRNAKIKINDINNDNHNDATDRPVYLNNESAPDAAIFSGANTITGAPAGATNLGGGSLLESDNDDEYFKEEEDTE